MAVGSGSGGTASGNGIDWTSVIAAGASGASSGGLGAVKDALNRKRLAQEQQQEQQLVRDTNNQKVAADESTLDPFRQQMAQANDLASLDRTERATYTPVSLSAAPGYEQYVPHLFGGASYEKSPELIQAAGALKRNILGGNVAPTMTDPTNYGKTATLNLLQIAAQGADPGTVSGAAGGPRDPNAYMTGVQHRDAGGLGTSDSRATDVSVDQAATILDRAIRSELGRAPNPGEIQQLLAAQGLKPGGRWVGSGGLTSLIQQIRASAAPQGAAAPPVLTGRG